MEAPGDHELAPDRRLDVEQGDTKLHGGWFFPGHVAIVTDLAGRRQLGTTISGDNQPASALALLPSAARRR
jgi:hypothetical protein